MSESHLWNRIRKRCRRVVSEMLCRRPLEIGGKGPIISFSFDDFPRSALYTGGAILKRYKSNGTYYVSMGLMGKEEPSGGMFLREDLRIVLQEGHELGCHTFDHCPAGETDPGEFDESIVENQRAVGDLIPGFSLRTLSYPISEPRAGTKVKAGRRYVCCRGGGQAFNVGSADLNCLKSFFLEQSRNDPEAVHALIDRNRAARGWLILSTHDISDAPSPYGCVPEFFEGIVRHAAESGARILPVIEAWKALSLQ
jgi:peptidoglycan/xylan/chitin deacetylase (PgdA/CDA1 family)